MKRSAIVVLVLVAGVTAMIWSGVMAYRMRKAINTPPVSPELRKMLNTAPAGQTAAGNQGNAASPDSPSAQGLPDLRDKPAPGFTLKNLDGKPVSLSDYKGKAVLLNFWATWCGPCKLEMPWLIALQKKYAAQGFTVLGISEDDDPPNKVSDFVSKMGVDYPVLMYDDKLNKAYGGIDYLPTSYYIGRDGKVVVESGGLISESEMEANIQKILAQGA
ncbi:MAG TPA: TlpA disulfide reductase family protein [Acidobacteriaceae bacterium]|nr:TlpA disulfide reductase family protein [Terriglobia bacterium]HVC89459.1 TlpA disulfide reductase family protein [Acidobacteriaceae bacterium]